MTGTGNEIALRDANGGQVQMAPAQLAPARSFQAAADLDSWISVVNDIAAFAEQVCRTNFVPKAYRNDPASTTAAILTGRELGLPPMTALRHVQVVEGMPGLSAEYKRARVLAAGHRLDITERTTEACTVTGHRKGHEPVTVRFTMEDARRAGLVESKPGSGPRPYKTRPRRMLFARACTEVVDALFADLTNGLPTAELLEEDAEAGEMAGYAEQAPPKRVTAEEARARAARANPVTGEVIPADAPDAGHDAPGSISPQQRTKLWAQLNGTFDFKRADKDAARAAIAAMAGRDLETSNNLSHDEASAVIDTLACCEHVAATRGGEPRQILDGILADPRGVALIEFGRLGYTGEGIVNTAGALLGITPPASLESLTSGQAALLAARLAGCAGKYDVDALLSAGEVTSGE